MFEFSNDEIYREIPRSVFVRCWTLNLFVNSILFHLTSAERCTRININCESYKFTILSAIYEWNRLTGKALYLPKPYPLKIQRVSSSSRLPRRTNPDLSRTETWLRYSYRENRLLRFDLRCLRLSRQVNRVLLLCSPCLKLNPLSESYRL